METQRPPASGAASSAQWGIRFLSGQGNGQENGLRIRQDQETATANITSVGQRGLTNLGSTRRSPPQPEASSRRNEAPRASQALQNANWRSNAGPGNLLDQGSSSKAPEEVDVGTLALGDFVYLPKNPDLGRYIAEKALAHPAVVVWISPDSSKALILTMTTFGSSDENPSNLGEDVYNSNTYLSIAPAHADPGNGVVLTHKVPGLTSRHPAWLCIGTTYEVAMSYLTYVFGAKGDAFDAESMEVLFEYLCKRRKSIRKFAPGYGRAGIFGVPEFERPEQKLTSILNNLVNGTDRTYLGPRGSLGSRNRVQAIPERSISNGNHEQNDRDHNGTNGVHQPEDRGRNGTNGVHEPGSGNPNGTNGVHESEDGHHAGTNGIHEPENGDHDSANGTDGASLSLSIEMVVILNAPANPAVDETDPEDPHCADPRSLQANGKTPCPSGNSGALPLGNPNDPVNGEDGILSNGHQAQQVRFQHD